MYRISSDIKELLKSFVKYIKCHENMVECRYFELKFTTHEINLTNYWAGIHKGAKSVFAIYLVTKNYEYRP